MLGNKIRKEGKRKCFQKDIDVQFQSLSNAYNGKEKGKHVYSGSKKRKKEEKKNAICEIKTCILYF